ncbi:MAG: hypothetical protein JST66_04645 [Bacteroidetes bacterium]|nr:hypothetical protein [Bacteroidota bacterium]
MSKKKATDVFTPGTFPRYTYVSNEESRLEGLLSDALETPGQVVSLSGPSKSGKTVLVEKVVGLDNLITITGAGLVEPLDVWDRVLDWMRTPNQVTLTDTSIGSIKIGVGGKAAMGIPLVAKGEINATGEAAYSSTTARSETRHRGGLQQVQKDIANSDFVILIDDFHYMPRNIQEEVAKQLKEAVRLGIKICTAAVRHRGDDVVRANPELRGRVTTVDLNYWNTANLKNIAELGFDALNISIDRTSLNEFASEAAGSPQLMQAICLNVCFELGIRHERDTKTDLTLSIDQRKAILQRTALTADFRSLVEILDGGPRTRGTERKTYKFKDGGEGDAYRCILKAVSANPPLLSFGYNDILDRVHAICDKEAPVGSSIIGSCQQMDKLAREKFPNERTIDWDDQKSVLDIPDPYLVFYLRWSDHLSDVF